MGWGDTKDRPQEGKPESKKGAGLKPAPFFFWRRAGASGISVPDGPTTAQGGKAMPQSGVGNAHLSLTQSYRWREMPILLSYNALIQFEDNEAVEVVNATSLSIV
jgi:hypothetical protein